MNFEDQLTPFWIVTDWTDGPLSILHKCNTLICDRETLFVLLTEPGSFIAVG